MKVLTQTCITKDAPMGQNVGLRGSLHNDVTETRGGQLYELSLLWLNASYNCYIS